MKRGNHYNINYVMYRFSDRTVCKLKDVNEKIKVEDLVEQVSTSRRGFTWSDGHSLGIGPNGMRQADKICAFYGGQMLYALRQVSDGKHSLLENLLYLATWMARRLKFKVRATWRTIKAWRMRIVNPRAIRTQGAQ